PRVPLRSRISWAMRVRARDIRSASMTCGMKAPLRGLSGPHLKGWPMISPNSVRMRVRVNRAVAAGDDFAAYGCSRDLEQQEARRSREQEQKQKNSPGLLIS